MSQGAHFHKLSLFESCVVVLGLIFTLATLAQVEARTKEIESKPRKALRRTPPCHLLSSPTRTSKLS
jgi:hypothetical protein